MGEIISERELRNDSARVLRELAAGASFVVTSNSQPVGELRALCRPHLARKEELIGAFRGVPRVGATRFREDVDAYLDQDPDCVTHLPD